MTATSLPGTIESHSALTNPGRSSRSGLTSTNSARRARAARRWSRAGCRLAPPGLTIVFLIGMPPKQTKSSVCRPSTDHALPRARNSRLDPPARGMMTDCGPLPSLCRPRPRRRPSGRKATRTRAPSASEYQSEGSRGLEPYGRGGAVEPFQDAIDVRTRLTIRGDAVMLDDRELAGVIGGEHERQVVPEAIHEGAQMPDAGLDVRSRIEGIVHPQGCGGLGHELHEPLRPLAGDGAWVELGLRFNDRGDELRRHPVSRGDLSDV